MSIYIPRPFAIDERASVARLIHDHPFATLVTPGAPEPHITHLPLIHVADCEPHGTLFGHFARANPHAEVPRAIESIAIFHGPHAYVSPSWYAERAAAVPTWNYAVVHAHGTIDFAAEPAQTRAVLDLLIQRFEGTRPQPWQLGLEGRSLAAMIGAIVGFRIKLTRVEAKYKMSQNRPQGDRVRVAAALDAEGYAEATATAAWMRTLQGNAKDAAD
jgi:transcriptional regulator